jgi:hypothetical protein
MRLDAGLQAESLLREHRDLLERLPLTFRAYVGTELERWPNLFAPEKAYLRALLERLARLTGPELTEAFAGLRRVESEAGCGEVRGGDARQVQDRTQALLRRKGLFPSWRREVDQVFQRLQPHLEERLYPKGSPRRVVVLLYGQGIAIQRDQLWRQFRAIGTRIPLRLEGTEASEPFLRALFAGLFSALGGLDPREAWIVDAGDTLHALCEERAAAGSPGAVGLSYARLRSYREELSRSLYRKVLAGVSSPQDLADYARALDIRPPEGTLVAADEVVRAFVRDVFLGGNGTLLVSNTFVEWAAVQALKRAEPRLLAARFGVRDKMKPFSSLLLFSSPRPTDQIPTLEDPLGSFVDVEQLSYYVWLNAEKSPAYRGKTLYLLLAEGVDEVLIIRPDASGAETGPPSEATLPELAATMAAWLGISLPASSARPLTPLVS